MFNVVCYIRQIVDYVGELYVIQYICRCSDDTIVEVDENSEQAATTHTLPPIGASEGKEKKDRKRKRKKKKKPKRPFDDEESDSKSEYVDTGAHTIRQVMPAENFRLNIPVTSTNEAETEVVDSGNENECPRTNSSDRNTPD